ncbi:hypothetical protein EDB92DRAFT_1892798 [Lactarius akahatsu]|uniref:Uncharacterized protein n=1 Tax=Lactarius akahatsu TaxID=416441 RepID=A0AAD4L6X2_9AGAM|nr:hypothetical protein EDB92DRAFT_1892798 [Lactarius akahatsu]
MDPFGNDDIAWLHSQLSDHAHGLNGVYVRVSRAIQHLEDEKSALQKRVEELERDNHPTSEARRLREENATLRAKLATTAKEKAEVTHERDVLLRKLNGVKQLVFDPAFDGKSASNDTHNAGPGPSTAASSSVPTRDPRAVTTSTTSTQRAVSAPQAFSSARTDISEPVTDVTVILDSPGRAVRPRPRTTPTRAASGSQQPLSMHSSMTLMDSRLHSQDEAPAALGAPFVDVRTAASPPADANGSPQRRTSVAHVFSLNVSPGMSEGLSVQYEDATASGAGPSRIPKKWRLHFAKPPTTAEAVAIKPVPTAVLAEKLELDEESRRAIEDLSLLPAGSFRLYIQEMFGLAFLYDPILLESPEATYVVEWSEATGAGTTKTYINNAKEKHTEMHTFIYAPRKSGWQYLGQQRWNVADIKSIWNSLVSPAQRALAARRSQDADIAEIARGLKKGQLEQLTVELQQVSLLGPNAAESAVMKKLSD